MRPGLRLVLLLGCVLVAAIESPLSALVVHEDLGAASRGRTGSLLGVALDRVVAHGAEVEAVIVDETTAGGTRDRGADEQDREHRIARR